MNNNLLFIKQNSNFIFSKNKFLLLNPDDFILDDLSNSHNSKNININYRVLYNPAPEIKIKCSEKFYKLTKSLSLNLHFKNNKSLAKYIKKYNYKFWGLTFSKIHNNKEEIIYQKIFNIDDSDDLKSISKKINYYEIIIIKDFLVYGETNLNNSKIKSIYYTDKISLRYGENSHQSALLYINQKNNNAGFSNFKQFSGKELSYNNIIDIDTAFNILNDFENENAVCIIKHNNPCGLATGKTAFESLKYAWLGDEISAFGSIVGFTETVDKKSAEFLSNKFIEVIVSRKYTESALKILSQKKNLRIIQVKKFSNNNINTYKSVEGGLIEQSKDTLLFDNLNFVTNKKKKSLNKNFIEFAIKTVKHLKSNAISLNYEYKKGYYCLVGKGIGQPNRIDSYKKLAMLEAKKFYQNNINPQISFIEFANSLLLASEAFFPFDDIIKAACIDGINFFVQPGGSIRDKEVIETANKFNAVMIFTKIRHFKH